MLFIRNRILSADRILHPFNYITMRIKTVGIFVFLLTAIGMQQGVAQLLSKEEIADRLNKEKARNIHLPATDWHYRVVKHYVEYKPDSDYYHASEEAYEAFRDIKFGVRIHWGIYSINQMNGESWGFLELDNAGKQQYQELYKTWNPTGFNADEWMDFFQRSGLQCFAFTSKHHEGFSMFDTKTRVKQRVNYLAAGGPAIEPCNVAYSIMETPFKRDIIKELCNSARAHKIKIDLYFSHPDWYDADFRPFNYHPLQTEDSKNHPTKYGDENMYKNSQTKIMVAAPSAEETQRMLARHREQIKELLTNYGKIDMMCLDQWLGSDVWPDLKATIKMARALQPDVMLRCRDIGNYGYYYTPEGFVPGNKENTNMPWMVIYPLASSFSYDKEAANYKGSKWIIDNLVDAVAKGGNFMVGIGPDGMGKFHPKAIKQLEETGDWLKINGEGIYATRPVQHWKEGTDTRFTSTKDKKYTYAFTLKWPGKQFILTTVIPVKGSAIYMLGYNKPLAWKYTEGKLVITIPDALQDQSLRPCKSAWGFRIEPRSPLK